MTTISTTLVEHTGQTFGNLTIGTRAGSDIAGHATWNATCTCGTQTTVRGDYLRTGRTWHCGCQGRKRRDILTYSGAHQRLRTALGPASAYTCPCGAQAHDWSFDGCDEAIVINGLAPYCPHACSGEYTARCRVCADISDLLVRKGIS